MGHASASLESVALEASDSNTYVTPPRCVACRVGPRLGVRRVLAATLPVKLASLPIFELVIVTMQLPFPDELAIYGHDQNLGQQFDVLSTS